MLKKIIEFWPLFGASLLMFGVIRLIGYYDTFDVPIIHFLEFNEIITSFFDFLTIIALIIISVPTGLLISSHHHSRIKAAVTNPSQLTRIRKRSKNSLNIFFILFVSSVTVLYLCGVIPPVFFWPFIIFLLSVFFFAKYMIYAVINYFQLLSGMSAKLRFIIEASLYIAVLSSIFYLLGIFQALFITQTHRYKYVCIYLLDNTIISSDSTNYYIGNTQNYLFYYHTTTKSTDVIPMNRVKEIDFKINGNSLLF